MWPLMEWTVDLGILSTASSALRIKPHRIGLCAPPRCPAPKADGCDELNEGEQATLRAVEEEARAEAEEKLARVEAVAGAGLAHLEEMQARVDEMM